MQSSDWLAAVLVRDSGCEPAPGESATGCDVPGGAVVFEAEVDQSFEVDDGSSSGERDAVAVDAAVTQTTMTVGDEPRDGALDHWSVLSVVVDEVGVGSPAGPVGGEVFVVFGDFECLAVDGGRASRSDGTTSTPCSEDRRARPADVGGDIVGAGDGPGGVVDGEIIAAELIVTQLRVRCERPWFDQDPMLGIGERSE